MSAIATLPVCQAGYCLALHLMTPYFAARVCARVRPGVAGRHPRLVVFLGAISALAVMTVSARLMVLATLPAASLHAGWVRRLDAVNLLRPSGAWCVLPHPAPSQDFGAWRHAHSAPAGPRSCPSTSGASRPTCRACTRTWPQWCCSLYSAPKCSGYVRAPSVSICPLRPSCPYPPRLCIPSPHPGVRRAMCDVRAGGLSHAARRGARRV